MHHYKIFMALALLVPFFLAPNLGAADLFINRNKDKQETQQEQPIRSAPPTTLQNKSAPKTSKGPKTIKQFSNAYYKNCKKQNHPVLKGDNLELLCACSSAKITQVMSLKNIQDMTVDTTEGLKQRNRLLTEVYVPCMEYPTKALLMSSCLKDPSVGQALKKPQEVCDCMSTSISKYIVREAPNASKRALAADAQSVDPLAALLNSKEYEQESQAHLISCLQKHEFGLK